MSNSKNNIETDHKSPRESGEDSEDESEILEESPCGRWSKRRQEVQQRDVPGIDTAYLAMDTEEGMEVVWNEFQVRFSERRNFKAQEDKIKRIFDNLTQLDHPNIVKLHKYWIDTKHDKRRVVFITEYMSSGSLKKFLKLTKRNVKKLPLQSWKRWCTQILSALSYLHSCSPPIIHGNLTTDSIFIQHNGLVKIGSVAPDAIQTHVKTCRGDIKNIHYVAPEYGGPLAVTPAVDIYSFGMCALEIAALEIPGNGDSGNHITQEQIQKTINSLEHKLQQDFISKCLEQDFTSRPVATKLLFHPVLFEVHSLKLLAAHNIIHNPKKYQYLDNCVEDLIRQKRTPESVVAELPHPGREPTLVTLADVPVVEKLEKFMEDVRYGIYPLTVFKLPPHVVRNRPLSPESDNVSNSDSTGLSGGQGNGHDHRDEEKRQIVNMMCSVRKVDEGDSLLMTLSLRLEDKMNRQLSCPIKTGEAAAELAKELVKYGFINQMDCDRVVCMMETELTRFRTGGLIMAPQDPIGVPGLPYQTLNGGESVLQNMMPAAQATR